MLLLRFLRSAEGQDETLEIASEPDLNSMSKDTPEKLA